MKRRNSTSIIHLDGHPTSHRGRRGNYTSSSDANLRERFALHVARGEMRVVDTRMAALALASPLLLAALHQNELQGDRVWPLAGEDFVDHLAEAFIRAYRTEPWGDRQEIGP